MDILARKEQLESIFEKNQVVLAYLFGSAAKKEKMSALSDIDIAVLFPKDMAKEERYRREFVISKEIGNIFNIDRVDVLNIAEISNPLLLKNAIIEASLLYSKDDKLRFVLEMKALREYEDTEYMRNVSYKIMRRQIKEGIFGVAKT
ncbi:MAG: hypothetical protein COV02_00895 [Candidatus Terrybacteria bacterium CG10_big_fil_rev_8_21_14_0_10_41_10]|uniref:Polymerase beta nucleotidyltransferase domain-containing protein n=1 Tax=Candidatus Terrybacteria bacterium CG10_big_fil_rev_8_21_14_0_10_41_10 TaxID=1975026 RepID=A0A2M8LAV4_9BACT|nr:MAG: hypothetical protein COV02_00895 [Candidatus Terrybacteria bacterium CG10_big_fil_rev_8_21_14_0_10_41_10]